MRKTLMMAAIVLAGPAFAQSTPPMPTAGGSPMAFGTAPAFGSLPAPTAAPKPAGAPMAMGTPVSYGSFTGNGSIGLPSLQVTTGGAGRPIFGKK